jgi:hypothetical protein
MDSPLVMSDSTSSQIGREKPRVALVSAISDGFSLTNYSSVISDDMNVWHDKIDRDRVDGSGQNNERPSTQHD